jgi:catechol 2,3-dioxygenase-like lactoylglutathione lyase family enzyme
VFDHVTIRVSDRGESERFYETVLGTLGISKTYSAEDLAEWDDFSLAQTSEDKPVTKRLHIGFAAPSREHVDAFWSAGTEAGFTSDGDPGPRPQYRTDYYGAFLLDPDGNSMEAVHHGAIREPGTIDHLWIRVANVAAARRFYETVAPCCGFRLDSAVPEHVRFVGAGGSFSMRQGWPSENVHLAFPAADNAAVDAFHRAAVEAGYRDNGAPGERPEYHPGYYGAYVLDPDGNNIEAVNHNRG